MHTAAVLGLHCPVIDTYLPTHVTKHPFVLSPFQITLSSPRMQTTQ